MIEIEKNIPPPPEGIQPRQRYPLAQMEVGDSFFSPRGDVSSAVSHFARRTGRKFTRRQEGDGFRIWRIA